MSYSMTITGEVSWDVYNTTSYWSWIQSSAACDTYLTLSFLLSSRRRRRHRRVEPSYPHPHAWRPLGADCRYASQCEVLMRTAEPGTLQIQLEITRSEQTPSFPIEPTTV
ncbi:hypothetical protein OG21DRAFT_634006 [Imleria badia]|nr:hypothetical protein OG21DRAFT_634006 [Imleria badia]